MKTLIIYHSKYGCLKECVDELKQLLKGDVDCVSVEKANGYLIDDYDRVLIGTSIYIGQGNKKIKSYIIQNHTNLLTKEIGLLISCGAAEEKEIEKYYSNAFTEELSNVAKHKANFGGVFHIEKMSFLDRFMIKQVMKSAEKEGKAMPKKIEGVAKNLAEVLNRDL